MKAVFRCELCGKEWTGFLADVDEECAKDIVVRVATSDTALIHLPSTYPASVYKPGTFYANGIHGCDDGSVGLARFVGFKMEENEKEDLNDE